MKNKRNTSKQFAITRRVRRMVAHAEVPVSAFPTRKATWPTTYRERLAIRLLLASGASFGAATHAARQWHNGRGSALVSFLRGAERAKQERREERAELRALRCEQRHERSRSYAAQIRRRYPMVAELERLYTEAQANNA